MSIYGRCGQVVKILRKAVLADVKKLDNRKPDKHDRERIKLGCYVVVEDAGKERLYDYVYLRADGACQEIDKAIEAAEDDRLAELGEANAFEQERQGNEISEHAEKEAEDRYAGGA